MRLADRPSIATRPPGGGWIARAHVAYRCAAAGANGATGELIPLAEQDRALWDQQQIAEGVAIISAALPKGAVGPYQLQAAIAAVHDEAGRADETDWPQILALYELLKRMSDNPMVRLNHAIAAAMVHGGQRVWNCWSPSMRMPASRVITGWTRLELICSSLRETARARSLITGRRQARQGVSRSGTTFLRRRRGSVRKHPSGHVA